jgi:hypothetical protein
MVMVAPVEVPLLRLMLVGLDTRVNVPEGLVEFHTHADKS